MGRGHEVTRRKSAILGEARRRRRLRALRALRDAAIQEGAPLLTEDEVLAEMRRRRGGAC